VTEDPEAVTVAAEYLEGPADGRRETVLLDGWGRPPATRQIIETPGIAGVREGRSARLGAYELVAGGEAADGSIRYRWAGWSAP
jgi:hypothetical protein